MKNIKTYLIFSIFFLLSTHNTRASENKVTVDVVEQKEKKDLTWRDLFPETKECLTQDGTPKAQYHTFLRTQYKAVINNTAPTIAHFTIKTIPITENNEPIVDVRTLNNPRITMLPNPPDNKPFACATCNSGLPNASKIRLNLYKRLEAMLTHLDQLSLLFRCKEGAISIKIFEGLRDLKTQTILFKNKFNEIKANNPSKTDEEIELETAKWVSPVKNNIPAHSTGGAVDIRLWDESTNSFIDLGKFGVLWGINDEAPTFSESISTKQKFHRLALLTAATAVGLVNYPFEYWHFSVGDRYAAYWQENDPNKRSAQYGAIE